jgi:hypothetical protein
LRRLEQLTDAQVAVLAAVERLGDPRLGDLYTELASLELLPLAHELEDLERLGFIKRANSTLDLSRRVESVRWTVHRSDADRRISRAC